MFRLAMMLFSLMSTTLMGSGVVVALVSGNDTLQPILIAACLGLVAAIPATWIVVRRLS